MLLVYLQVPAHPRAAAAQPAGYFTDLLEGLAYIRRHGYLKAFFLFSCVVHVLVGPQAFLSPLQVARTYGDEVWRLSAIEMGWSLGMVLGGLLMASWGGFRNKLHSMALANFTFGVGGILFGLAPPFPLYVAMAADRALAKAGLRREDVGLVEINEAFAVVALVSTRLGGWDPEIVNVNGGAIALGHPIGASGARIVLTLALEMRQRGVQFGLAAICSGGGQGDAVGLARVDS